MSVVSVRPSVWNRIDFCWTEFTDFCGHFPLLVKVGAKMADIAHEDVYVHDV